MRGKESPTVDQDIALQLRKSEKRIVLVVNKAEAAKWGLICLRYIVWVLESLS